MHGGVANTHGLESAVYRLWMDIMGVVHTPAPIRQPGYDFHTATWPHIQMPHIWLAEGLGVRCLAVWETRNELNQLSISCGWTVWVWYTRLHPFDRLDPIFTQLPGLTSICPIYGWLRG
jgi:hypothetical protein